MVSGLDRYYDLRRLPNDAWVVDGYKNKNGLDQTIRTLVFENEKTRTEYMKIKDDICKYISSKMGLDLHALLVLGASPAYTENKL